MTPLRRRMIEDMQIRNLAPGTQFTYIIIDYATARRREEPISTAVTGSTVQWLLHRRMNAQQQMQRTPRGAHLMLKVRCAVMNGTFEYDHAVAEGRACRLFRRVA